MSKSLKVNFFILFLYNIKLKISKILNVNIACNSGQTFRRWGGRKCKKIDWSSRIKLIKQKEKQLKWLKHKYT